MSQTRRDFLKAMSAVAASHAASGQREAGRSFRAPSGMEPRPHAATVGDPHIRELTQVALDAATSAGASYADVRFSDRRSQSITTRERQLQGVEESETHGIGVRTLVSGAWGFVATDDLTRDAVARAAREAVTQARANASVQRAPVVLAPVTSTPNGTWRSPMAIDPFTVAVTDKVALLLAANDAALNAGAKFVNSGMRFVREEKTLATSDGTFVVQTLCRSQPYVTVTVVASDASDFQTRTSFESAPRGLGYEHIIDGHLVENAPRWAAEALEKLRAKPVAAGQYDLVLHPTHLWLTIHESIAHPTELDRVYGYEANYAGTSFVSPPERTLGKLRYGSPLLNIHGDREQHGSLAAIGWDDEGVRPDDFPIIESGVLVDYQTTREQAAWLSWWYDAHHRPVRSHGCSYAQSWQDVQFQRMPNVSLRPGRENRRWEDLIAATDRGIAIMGDGSFSIDQQRLNAQFGGQLFYEIKGGKIVGMFKDVAYQMRTPDFWGGMDMIGGADAYFMGGAFNDGKGQPSQINAVSHGCVPARFRQVNVINTGRTA